LLLTVGTNERLLSLHCCTAQVCKDVRSILSTYRR
jgi:hypothetical protein